MLAETKRLSGQAAFQRGDFEIAYAAFTSSIETSQGQEARMFELKGATGAARCLHRMDRSEGGRELLAQAYDWFTEGFDVPDLIEAKTLLGELS